MDRRRSETSEKAAAQVAWVLEGAPESAMLTDADGLILYVNPAFEALTGYTRAEVLGRRPSLLKSGRQSPEFYQRLWRELRAGREFRGVFVNRRKDGSLFHEDMSVRPLVDGAGRSTHYLACGRDVSEHVATFERLTRAATHDGLTGLPNRSLFADRLRQRLQRTRREGDRFALALVDVNDFKLVNDLHGHATGDAVLCQVAQRLQHAVREADTVARLGGDEFALLLAGAADAAACESALQKIVAACRAPLTLADGRCLVVSVSVGACVAGPDDHDGPRLLEYADAAMYRAKRAAGRGYEIAGGAAPPALLPPATALRLHS